MNMMMVGSDFEDASKYVKLEEAFRAPLTVFSYITRRHCSARTICTFETAQQGTSYIITPVRTSVAGHSTGC